MTSGDLRRAASPRSSAWGVVGIVAIVAGAFASLRFVETDRPLFAVLAACVAISLFVFAISRSTKAESKATARTQERIDAIETDPRRHDDERVIRRKAPRTWPIVITLLSAAPAAIFFVMGETGLALAFLLFAGIVALVTWLIAGWMGSGTIAKLTLSGIELRAGTFSWEEIASIDVFVLSRLETGLLTLRLTRPRAPRTLGQRINSLLSGGSADREIVVSLARADEEPEVIREILRDRWKHALGKGRAEAAEHARLGRVVQESRTWSEFSTAEKSRSLKAFGWIIAVAALCVYGLSADFRMSDRWAATSLTISGLLTVVGVFKLVRAKVFVSLRNQQGTPSYLILFLIVCGLCWMALWSALGRGLPDVFARHWGKPSTVDVRYDKQHYRSGENCTWPLSIYLTDVPFRFCSDAETFAELPAEGSLSVELRQTWFGMHIVRFSTKEI